MTWDLNNADKQQGSTIPEDVYRLKASMKEGGYGDDYLLHRSNSGGLHLLVLDYTVVDGEYRGRKFRDWIVVEYLGNEPDQKKAENYKIAERIGRAKLRAMLESSRGFDSNDDSDAAKAARKITSLQVFDGLIFTAHVGVKPPQNGYREKNYIYQVVYTGEPSDGAASPTPSAVPPKSRKDFDDEIPFN